MNNIEIKLSKNGKGWKLVVFKDGYNQEFYYTDMRDVVAKAKQLKG